MRRPTGVKSSKVATTAIVTESKAAHITAPEPAHEALAAKTSNEPSRPATTQRSAPDEAIEQEAKQFVYMHESSGRTDAINKDSGARGLGQALPCDKLTCSLSDYACQDAWFTRYAMERYGSWAKAMGFWKLNHWW